MPVGDGGRHQPLRSVRAAHERPDHREELPRQGARRLGAPAGDAGPRAPEPRAESSFDAWIKLYKPDESNLNTTVSYYLKGGLAMFALDLQIRRRTEGARSPRRRAAPLWTRYGAARAAPRRSAAAVRGGDRARARRRVRPPDPRHRRSRARGELAHVGLELRGQRRSGADRRRRSARSGSASRRRASRSPACSTARPRTRPASRPATSSSRSTASARPATASCARCVGARDGRRRRSRLAVFRRHRLVELPRRARRRAADALRDRRRRRAGPGRGALPGLARRAAPRRAECSRRSRRRRGGCEPARVPAYAACRIRGPGVRPRCRLCSLRLHQEEPGRPAAGDRVASSPETVPSTASEGASQGAPEVPHARWIRGMRSVASAVSTSVRWPPARRKRRKSSAAPPHDWNASRPRDAALARAGRRTARRRRSAGGDRQTTRTPALDMPATATQPGGDDAAAAAPAAVDMGALGARSEPPDRSDAPRHRRDQRRRQGGGQVEAGTPVFVIVKRAGRRRQADRHAARGRQADVGQGRPRRSSSPKRRRWSPARSSPATSSSSRATIRTATRSRKQPGDVIGQIAREDPGRQRRAVMLDTVLP